MRYGAWLLTCVCLSSPISGSESADKSADSAAVSSQVDVRIFENVEREDPWSRSGEATATWQQPAFAWTQLPRKYARGGLIADRSNPFVLVGEATLHFPAGTYDFLLRAKNLARVCVDGNVVLQQEKRLRKNADGHESVPELPQAIRPGHHAPPSLHQERMARLELTAGFHQVRVESLVGGANLRSELGELCVAVAPQDDSQFRVLTADTTAAFPLTDAAWSAFQQREVRHLTRVNTAERRVKLTEDRAFWDRRHAIARETVGEQTIAVPAVRATASVRNAVDHFIVHALEQQGVRPQGVLDDLPFLRRLALDVVGQTPSLAEIREFRADSRPDRRARWVDRFLDDPRWADHWVPYWQDVLAENPNILKASLNNTGPFRWWIYESFLDNKSIDQFASDLILMKGSRYQGGPAGFAMATQNDVPAANKALILGEAFLATNMNCARCHDSPVNDVTQKQLFQIAAMLEGKALKLPETSTVKQVEGHRAPLIEVSLQPGDLILPHWPLHHLAEDTVSAATVQDPNDSRAWLAAILTAPKNTRFAQVIVNRLWHRYMGRGLVTPVDDWAEARPSHPELLDFLAHELITHDYDLKHVARLILNSQTYQRTTSDPSLPEHEREAQEQWFAAATRRRLTAEQIFDSLFGIIGKPLQAERLTMDPEGRRPIKSFLNLGIPQRAWQFSSLSNERDRPALSLPVAQSVNDLLKAFGWREARQDAATARDETMTPTQPLVLANGTMGQRIVRLSDDHAVTELSLYEESLDSLIDSLYWAFLTRSPQPTERSALRDMLQPGFTSRRVRGAPIRDNRYTWQRHAVSWSNHLHPTASDIMLQLEARAKQGDLPTARLEPDWRERMEDVLWALVNNVEFVFSP